MLTAHGDEADGVTGFELTQLPAFRGDDGNRTDESAEAGAVRSQQDRGVAGEVQRPNRVGVVVDVGAPTPISK